MTWGKKQIAGVVYALGHLDPFVMDVKPKAADAPTYKVHVSFGCHTFTKAWDDSYSPDLLFTSDGEERCFCTDRHGYSLHLPGIVQHAAGGKAHFSRVDNFLIVRTLPRVNGPYAIFFDVVQARSQDFDVAMSVVSAYPKPDLPPASKISQSRLDSFRCRSY
jgi:hypothetical protein